MKPNIGLSDSNRDDVVKLLTPLLADEYLLYTKTRNYHWNVVGPQFNDLHKFFEAQYEELDDFVDEVAERIRQLGAPSPGTLAEFTKTSRLNEHPGQHPAAKAMIAALLADHEAVIKTLRSGSHHRSGQVQRRGHLRLPDRADGEAREDGLDAARLRRLTSRATTSGASERFATRRSQPRFLISAPCAPARAPCMMR